MNLEILAQNNVCTDLCTDTEHTKIAQFSLLKKTGPNTLICETSHYSYNPEYQVAGNHFMVKQF